MHTEIADGLLKSEEQLLEGGDRELQKKLRAHPLFFGVTMGLLAEIINSRYTYCVLVSYYSKAEFFFLLL